MPIVSRQIKSFYNDIEKGDWKGDGKGCVTFAI